MDFGRKVATLRKSQGMTQEDLGKVLNVTYQAVSKWERGESLPDIEMMSRIAKYFQVPIGYFVDGEENYQQTATASAPATAEIVGMCTQCGKMVAKTEVAQMEPKIICKSCSERIKQTNEQRANYAKQKEIAEQRGHGFDFTLVISLVLSLVCYVVFLVLCLNHDFAEDGEAYGLVLFIAPLAVFGAVQAFCGFIKELKDVDFDDEVGYTRNLSLIVAGAVALFNIACFLVLYISKNEAFYIIMLVLSTVLSFTFISQFMWGGIIKTIFTAGGFTFKLPGFIFSLDIDSILFMLIAKLLLGILAAIVFVVTTVLVTIFAIVASAITFIPSVITKSVKDTNVAHD